jgi:hypothetical protein
MAALYADTVRRAEQNQWSYRQFLQHLCESEAEDRRQRRVARLLNPYAQNTHLRRLLAGY